MTTTIKMVTISEMDTIKITKFIETLMEITTTSIVMAEKII